MDNARKKEILRTAKEQKARPGIYAIRCTVSGEVWVSKAADLDKRKAGLWFQLNMGSFPGKSLQAAWNIHGEAAFVYIELEDVRDDNELLIPSLLKDREAHWRLELSGMAVA